MTDKIPYLNKITLSINDSFELKQKLLSETEIISSLSELSQKLINVISNGNKIFFAGNGGSASDAQHLAAEFICRLEKERDSLPAIALTTDTSIITAISNDYSFEELFSRQLLGLASKGDMFIGITTSGKSPNIIKAFEICINKKIHTACLCGANGLSKDLNVEHIIKVPSYSTQRIQEVHILFGHIMCEIVENQLFPN